MTDILPEYAQINQPILYNDAVEKTDIIDIECSQAKQEGLNRAGSQLLFTGGDALYRLGSPKSGFRIKYEFRTKMGANNDRNALSTLASNFFGYSFKSASLKLGGYDVENITNLGVVMDCLYHCEESDFRNKSGIRLGFVPDTSSQTTTTIGTRTGDVDRTSANTAALADEVNAADNKIVGYNSAFNEGFNRRLKAYNYTVAANDEFRRLEIFIPLNRIFGFCNEMDRVLKYMPFEVSLYRTDSHLNSVFGAANTSLDFGQAKEGGITEIKLELERITFKPTIATQVEEMLSKPFEATYLRRICDENQELKFSKTGNWTQFFDKDSEGLPRYVFVVFKNTAVDTSTTNFQRCVHANIQNISIKYANQTYPDDRQQNADFLNNEFSRFYDDFCEVARSLGFDNPGLSWEEFRDMYTIFAIDLSAQPTAFNARKLTLNFERRVVPANAGAATDANPREIRGFFVVLSECKVVIDCNQHKVRKL